MDKQAIIVSMQGIQREINQRTWELSQLVNRILGKDHLVYPKLEADQINKSLKLHREVKRLRIIKAELNLILTLQQ